MPALDRFDLQRFVTAQARAFPIALDELRAGKKRSHWMWYIFPQLRGLGVSSTAQLYGVDSLEEARAYLAHPLLGPRLRHCTEVVVEAGASSLIAIFGSPDDLKFRSSATLFAEAEAGQDNLFRRALERWCDGLPDERTLALIAERGQ
jgi:uncharacterized protein (DUF1810 family)